MNLKVEVDESGWGSCPVMGFGISYSEHLLGYQKVNRTYCAGCESSVATTLVLRQVSLLLVAGCSNNVKHVK